MNAPAAILTCDQCGTSLRVGHDRLGCMNCLLTGGLAPKNGGRGSYQHYEILRREDGEFWELGRGAMGVTYKAIDTNLQVPVALKIIGAGAAAHPEARARFLREARVAARLRHPNVASVFHFGTVAAIGAGEECFYAMEFVEGETLEAFVRRTGPLGAALALAVVVQVTRALAAAEKRGLVHRDLKPSNIMIVAGGGQNAGKASAARLAEEDAWIKVIDFGLAKVVDDDARESSPGEPPTHAGFLGTPQFASPEQYRNVGIDTRSDIFSLGVTLWYLLTGTFPFSGRSPEEVHDWQTTRPLLGARLDDARVPAGVEELLRSMLSVDPAGRPSSAAMLDASLRRCLVGLDPSAPAAPSSRRRWLPGMVIVALAMMIGATAHLLKRSPGTQATAPASTEVAPSIAILPLESLNEDKADAFFAAGIQDDVITSLMKIGQIRVIGRSSVRQFPVGVARDARAAGRALGAGYVLEGSVRRDGNRVLVVVHLTDTRDGHQVWSERYDWTLQDTLTLQGELASEIAASLHAKLSPEEKIHLQAKPTGNPDAYVLYLQGRAYELRSTFATEDYRTAAKFYTEAVALDPGFALARARLAGALSYIYRNSQPEPETKNRAYTEATEALRLVPDLGEGHLALALCYYRIDRDYPAAQRELKIAAQFLPNEPEISITRAFIYRRQGRWRESLDDLETLLKRDPRNMVAAHELFITAFTVRDWTRTIQAGDLLVAVAPDSPTMRLDRAYVDLWAKGDITLLRKTLTAIPSDVDPDGTFTWMRWDAAMLVRDFDDAERAVERSPGGTTLSSLFGIPLPKSYLSGCTALARGETVSARAFFEVALPEMETQARSSHAQIGEAHARLGLLYAYLGRKDLAIREGRAAIELPSVAQDARASAFCAGYLALIYARTGEAEQAIPLIEHLLEIPGSVFTSEASVTLSDLRLRWQWDPLREKPKFQQILARPEPKTVY